MSLYTEAAQFLTGSKPGSLKGTIYRAYESDKKLKSDPRQVVVLVTNTLRYKTCLQHVIKISGILKTEKRLKQDIAMLMVYDLIISKSGRINCGKSLLKDAVLRHKTRLKGELTKYKIKHKATSIEQLMEGDDDETPVRWIRINNLRAKDGAEKQFIGNRKLVESIDEIEPGTVYKDIHVKNLYGIHPSEGITQTALYKTGQIIIQDRASCFPAEILSPQPGDNLIDACSAPGNKTSHLAAHISGKGTVTAFERDKKRSQILRKMISMAGADKCVDVKVQDFTASDPAEFTQVTGMLVDPSCSGSGIFGRGFDEEQADGEADKDRLKNLAEFQFKIVRHALSFPNVKCVVYSTCSIHAEENEQVVARLLQDESVQERGWKLRNKSHVLPNWPRRGLDDPSLLTKAQSQSCVRALPKTDGGIGFFAACFERPSF